MPLSDVPPQSLQLRSGTVYLPPRPLPPLGQLNIASNCFELHGSQTAQQEEQQGGPSVSGANTRPELQVSKVTRSPRKSPPGEGAGLGSRRPSLCEHILFPCILAFGLLRCSLLLPGASGHSCLGRTTPSGLLKHLSQVWPWGMSSAGHCPVRSQVQGHQPGWSAVTLRCRAGQEEAGLRVSSSWEPSL